MELTKLASFLDLSKGQVKKAKLRSKLKDGCTGVYSFYWTGDLSILKEAKRQVSYQGKKLNEKGQEEYDKVDIEWEFSDHQYQCLYVGKTHNFPNRLGLHVKAGTISENWYKANEEGIEPDQKSLHKPTTSCQLRSGMEHLFQDSQDGLRQLCDNVAFHFELDFSHENRFYRECELIGKLRPWFNMDVER